MHKLIGFHGLPGAGKDTMVDRLSLHRVCFADKLKEVCFSIYGAAYNVPKKAFYGTQADKRQNLGIYDKRLEGVTGRSILKLVGTDGFRAATNTVWIDAATHEIKRCLAVDKYVGVPDTRFPNEFEAIHRMGGIVVGLERVDPEYELDGHESDTLHFDKCDIIINNTHTSVEQTLRQLAELLEALN